MTKIKITMKNIKKEDVKSNKYKELQKKYQNQIKQKNKEYYELCKSSFPNKKRNKICDYIYEYIIIPIFYAFIILLILIKIH